MLDLLTLLEFVNKVFVHFTLDFFKGSVILCIICVCVQGMLGNNIRNLENPVLGNRRLGIAAWELPRCECYYPETLANMSPAVPWDCIVVWG